MLVQIKKQTLEDLILSHWIMQRICDGSITKQQALAMQKRMESVDAAYNAGRESGRAVELVALYDQFRDLAKQIAKEEVKVIKSPPP